MTFFMHAEPIEIILTSIQSLANINCKMHSAFDISATDALLTLVFCVLCRFGSKTDALSGENGKIQVKAW